MTPCHPCSPTLGPQELYLDLDAESPPDSGDDALADLEERVQRANGSPESHPRGVSNDADVDELEAKIKAVKLQLEGREDCEDEAKCPPSTSNANVERPKGISRLNALRVDTPRNIEADDIEAAEGSEVAEEAELLR